MNGEDKIVVLKQYSDLTEAELAKNLLVRNGIPAFISNHNGATMLPIPAIRISLHVKENDLANATALIREWKSNSDSYEPDFREADHDDIAFEKALQDQKNRLMKGSDITWLFLLGLLIFGLLLLSKMR